MNLDDTLRLQQHPGTDPRPFTATITEIEGESVRLDRTWFYPVGGGQPADHGHFTTDSETHEVIDVRGRGRIMHQMEGHDLEVGAQVEAMIDGQRRNTLSLMHTAQHLVSAHADILWSGRTVGNQIGVGRTRIDLEFPDRGAFDRQVLETAVNGSIEDDRDIRMSFVDREELVDDPLVRVNMERMPADIERWRVIEIEGIDRCPCAGTHVASTRLIPPIEITRVKSKGKGRLRVEYETVQTEEID